MTAIHLKIEHDIIDKPFKLDILNEIPPQVNEISQHFIHEIKTKGYDVIGVNLFPLLHSLIYLFLHLGKSGNKKME